ncbi:MAG: hypothetical protein MOGDAGHF_02897 [Rhodocyclaceae bacterium]|nr:hypothetical protein [Rhodocyclaceae bacterium]
MAGPSTRSTGSSSIGLTPLSSISVISSRTRVGFEMYQYSTGCGDIVSPV